MGRTAVMVIQRIAVREVFPTTKKKRERECMSCLKCVICVPSGSQLSSVKYQVSCNCKSQAASMDFLMCSGLYKMHNGMVSTKKMHN